MRACLVCGLMAMTLITVAPTQALILDISSAGTPPASSDEANLGFLLASSLANPDEPPRQIRIRGGGRLQLENLAPGGWTLKLESDRFWSPELKVEAESQEPIPWILYPAASIRLERPKTVALPSEVAIVFSAVEKRAPTVSLSGRTRCAGGPEAADCKLPAGLLDLRVEAAGFAPSFFWGVESRPGEVTRLGAIPLLSGASIAGSVVDGDGNPLAGAEIEAYPSMDQNPGSADVSSIARFGLKVTRAKSDERGHFQIVGIEPGHRDLRVKAQGFSSATLAREIQLEAGTAKLLEDPLVLMKPASLRLQILPEVDPWGKTWIVELMASPSPEAPDPQKAAAAADGRWESSPTPPGLYLIRISDSQGQLWDMQETQLVNRMDVLPMNISVLPIRGQVTLAGDPFTGSLNLSRRASVPGIRFSLDDNGRFDGYLPGEGRWLASTEKDGERRASLLAIDIVKARGKSYAEIDLKIPNTHISGDVVDESGKPVAGAEISYFSFAVKSSGTVVSDSLGNFEIFGIEAGNVGLTAKKASLLSQGLIAEVREDVLGPPYHLILLERLKVEGQVVDSGAPQAGIRLTAWPAFGSSSSNSVFRQSTDLNGIFEFDVPGFVSQLVILVEERGGARQLLAYGVQDQPKVVIEANVDSGDLAVDLSAIEPARKAEPFYPVLLGHDGIQFPSLMWPLIGIKPDPENPNIYRFGKFAAGNYTLCAGNRDSDGKMPACSHGYLPSNGTLTLKIPAPGQQDSENHQN